MAFDNVVYEAKDAVATMGARARNVNAAVPALRPVAFASDLASSPSPA